MSQEALEDALFTEDVALLAAHGVDEGLEAEAACIEGLNRVLPEPLLLRPVPKLPLLIVREEREVIVVLRVPLRHRPFPSPGFSRPTERH